MLSAMEILVLNLKATPAPGFVAETTAEINKYIETEQLNPCAVQTSRLGFLTQPATFIFN